MFTVFVEARYGLDFAGQSWKIQRFKNFSEHGLVDSGLLFKRLSPPEISGCESKVISTIQTTSRNLAMPNFRQLGPDDLTAAFDAIDQWFLNGAMRKAAIQPSVTLDFRLAKRMTHTGGTTAFRKRNGKRFFEISIAPRVIHETFQAVDKALVCGLECEDMRMALVRIMQHEMIHLAEFLCWGDSSCNANRFREIVLGLFGHTESRHRMLTPAERSRLTHQLGPGDRVVFSFEGKQMKGVVNRINKRATVLVPSSNGRRYSDGGVYVRYYVPLNQLNRE